MQEHPRVIARLRPLLSFEDQPAWVAKHNQLCALTSRQVKTKMVESHLNPDHLYAHPFSLDRVFESTSSERIYKSEAKAMIHKSMRNCIDTTIAAYGQTCGGKTYTMLGVKEAPGLIPCTFREVFGAAQQNGYKYSLKVCYIEIYNENLYDLLDPSNRNLKIVKDEQWGYDVAGARKQGVRSFEECLELLDQGEENRRYAAKKHHEHSSRSHTLLRMHIEGRTEQLRYIRSTINLVDLAGSERYGEGRGTAETGFINKSLFQFSNVIAKLSNKDSSFIPFRDSKLTRVLQTSLTQNSQVLFIFCLSPAVPDLPQTIASLRLAQKACKIEITCHAEGQPDDAAQIGRLKSVIRDQELQIERLKDKVQILEEEIEANRADIEDSQTGVEASKGEHGPSLALKAVILFNLSDFVVGKDGEWSKPSDLGLEGAKQSLTEELQFLYQKYSLKIVRGLQDKSHKNWVAGLNKVVVEAIHSESEEIRSLQREIISRAINSFNEGPTAKLTAPRCAQGGGTAARSQGGKVMLGWGCKKDCRVFLADHNDEFDVGELTMAKEFKEMACGAHHTLACSTDGLLYGWGKNQSKQLSHRLNAVVQIPKQVHLDIRVCSVSAGWTHSICASDTGRVFTWGHGPDGQLGLGDQEDADAPTEIDQGQGRVLRVYAGHSHSGYIDENGNYFAFGFNADCRLMLREKGNRRQPTQVKIGKVKKAALGVTHSCILTEEGRVYCGGVGANGELGVILDSTIPCCSLVEVAPKSGAAAFEMVCPIVEVEEFTSDNLAIDIACGENSTAVINARNQLFTFGKASFERLGHDKPGIEKILDGVSRVELGYRHGFAWSEPRKEVFGWGFNMYNQLGTLQAKDLKKPQVIAALSNRKVMTIKAGFFHSAAIAE